MTLFTPVDRPMREWDLNTVFIKSYLKTLSILPPRFKLLNDKVTDISLSTPLSYETFQFPGIKPVTSSLSEKERVLTALKDSRWNRAKAADNLNISRTTLWRLMKKYNLK